MKNLVRLVNLVRQLRGPDGCPWDRKQTHRSLRRELLEECYEVLEAMESGTVSEFRDELGDLLLQIILHAQIARERGAFDLDSVAASVADKLVRRHPHIFGKTRLRHANAVLHQWEMIKKAEKNSESIFSSLPRCLPALLKADKVQRKAARVGFDWQRAEDVVAKVEEELRELKSALAGTNRRRIGEELGDLLFAVVNLARFKHFSAEELLSRAVDKFVRRFQAIEQAVRAQGKQLDQCSLEQLDALWESAKRPLKARKRHDKSAAPVRSS